MIESKDAGQQWAPKSLLGKADFHVLSSMHGRIYGFDSTGQRFMVSQDGKDWATRASVDLLSFAVSPSDPAVILGATPLGLRQTSNGGSSWSPASGPTLVLLSWFAADKLDGVDAVGGLHLSRDEGTSWTALGNLPGHANAFPATEEQLYAAVHEDAIYGSSDFGLTWSAVYRRAQ